MFEMFFFNGAEQSRSQEFRTVLGALSAVNQKGSKIVFLDILRFSLSGETNPKWFYVVFP